MSKEAYEGTASEVWNSWSIRQRDHFSKDHKSEFEKGFSLYTLLNKEFDELPKSVKTSIEKHIKADKYAKGKTVKSRFIGDEFDEMNRKIDMVDVKSMADYLGKNGFDVEKYQKPRQEEDGVITFINHANTVVIPTIDSEYYIMNTRTFLTSDNFKSKEDVLKELKVFTSESYKRGATVKGQKHVSVTTGHRLPKGYEAIKGDDKNKVYSKGHPKVRVDAGWRLPHGYETTDGAYIQKYAKGGGVDKEKVMLLNELYREHNREQMKKGIKPFTKESVDLWNEEYEDRYKKLNPNFEEMQSLNPKNWYAKGATVVADIEKAKKSLINKAKYKGIYANFGSEEFRELESKYGSIREVNEFENWKNHFDLLELKRSTRKTTTKDAQEDFDFIRDLVPIRIIENLAEVFDEKPFVEMEKIAHKTASKANFDKFCALAETISNKWIKEPILDYCKSIKSNRHKSLFKNTYGGKAGDIRVVSQVSSLFDLFIQSYHDEQYALGGGIESKWEGVDADLQTSLEEYGFVATVNENCTEEGEHFVIYKIDSDNFSYGYVTESALNDLINAKEWASEEDVESFIDTVGMSKEEWLGLHFVSKLSDVISYWGIENIMGTSTDALSREWAYEKIGLDIGSYEGEEAYKRGATVKGKKHVSVTTGHRLPKGYEAVRGEDKNKVYSKGRPKVWVDAGWRLPKGYETTEGAYNQKYAKGATIKDRTKTLQELIKEDNLSDEQRESLFAMLSKGLRSESKLRSLKSVTKYGMSKFQDAWFSKRFFFEGDKLTYSAGQSHPEEMRSIAQELTTVK